MLFRYCSAKFLFFFMKVCFFRNGEKHKNARKPLKTKEWRKDAKFGVNPMESCHPDNLFFINPHK